MPRCDNASVGVLITDHRGRLLLIERVRPPFGLAPVAGHVDDHGSCEDAARAEVAEEVGLTVTNLTAIANSWRNNACRRTPGPNGVGHSCAVYRATVVGEVSVDPQEVAGVRWCTARRLQRLADRTVAYAHGRLTGQAYVRHPGLEPVWVRFAAAEGLVEVNERDLVAVDRLAALPPERWP